MKIEDLKSTSSVRLPTGKPKVVFSSRDHRGLQLIVKRGAPSSWGFRYTKSDGRRTNTILGQLPGMAYDDAVQEIAKCRDMLAKGVDPAEQRTTKINRQRQDQYLMGSAVDQAYRMNTLAAGFLEYCEAKLRPGTVSKYRSSLDVHVLPAMGGSDVRFVRFSEFETLIYGIAQKHRGAARQVFATTRAMMSWLVRERVIDSNPLLGREDLVKRTKVAPRRTRLSGQDLHRFLNEIDDQAIPDDAKTILKLQLYTGLRIGEVCGIKWPDIDFKAGVINHPREAMKGDTEAYTAMSEAVMVMLLEWKRAHPKGKARVFGSEFDTDRMVDILRNTLSRWIGFRSHDLRRTMTSELQRIGCPEEIRRRIQNHKTVQGIARSYDIDPQMELQLEWLERWAAILAALKADPNYLDGKKDNGARAKLLAQYQDVLS